MKSLSLLFPLIFASSVLAHGFVDVLTLGSQAYQGQEPTEDGQPNNASVIRRISKIDPVKGATNPDVNCGNSAEAVSSNANANPGDKVLFKWIAGGGENWPHDTGPMLTYMASCGSTTCDQFDATTAKWFKIQEIGLDSSTESGWAQADLMNGTPANITLPSNLAPGNYLLRHEIIALHLANTMGGAEFYPSCSQIIVGGSGTGKPSDDELVSLPGAYSDSDPGIYVPSIFDGITNYTFPGPAIAAFVSGASAPSSTASSKPTASKSASSTASAPSSTSTKASGSVSNASSGQCRLRPQVQNAAQSHLGKRTFGLSAGVVRPRKMSRVMRDLWSPGSILGF